MLMEQVAGIITFFSRTFGRFQNPMESRLFRSLNNKGGFYEPSFFEFN